MVEVWGDLLWSRVGLLGFVFEPQFGFFQRNPLVCREHLDCHEVSVQRQAEMSLSLDKHVSSQDPTAHTGLFYVVSRNSELASEQLALVDPGHQRFLFGLVNSDLLVFEFDLGLLVLLLVRLEQVGVRFKVRAHALGVFHQSHVLRKLLLNFEERGRDAVQDDFELLLVLVESAEVLLQVADLDPGETGTLGLDLLQNPEPFVVGQEDDLETRDERKVPRKVPGHFGAGFDRVDRLAGQQHSLLGREVQGDSVDVCRKLVGEDPHLPVVVQFEESLHFLEFAL